MSNPEIFSNIYIMLIKLVLLTCNLNKLGKI